jgi:uncharacterized iron-regulated protein
VTGASTAWRFGAALLVGGYAAVTGCASTTPGLDAHSAALARLVAARAAHADIVYLGESHDNPHHHLDQIRVLEVMLADGARPALAFEMLAQDQQQAVDVAMLESADRSALAKRLGWGERAWPDFEMYRPLFDLARRYGLPVIAIDLSQPVVRRISKEGLAALPADEQRRLVSRLVPDADRERGLARDIEAAHCGLLPAAAVPGMVDAWHARNVTMARQIIMALERAPQVVVIVGRGHQAPGGLADQVGALRPGTRQLIVDLVEAGEGKPDHATPDDGIGGGIGGRIVWSNPPVERPDPCAPLRAR